MQLTVSNAKASRLECTLQTRRLILRNTGTNTIYFGYEPTVTAAGETQGVPLKPDEILTLDQGGQAFQDSFYMICAAGQTSTINYTSREA
ncbi:MAG TPA: hypothetical protein VD994_20330 [Prosthecobacter sp.]|nr:hypothetical protein [Prosthecobacter sp.]